MPLYRTTIAVGDYPVDQHHDRYDGNEPLPDLHFHPVPSYGLPLGTLIPVQADNLVVAEKSISVSNVVNGTTRLQPVVLQIGTSLLRTAHRYIFRQPIKLFSLHLLLREMKVFSHFCIRVCALRLPVLVAV